MFKLSHEEEMIIKLLFKTMAIEKILQYQNYFVINRI